MTPSTTRTPPRKAYFTRTWGTWFGDPQPTPTSGTIISSNRWIFYKPTYERMELVDREDLDSDPGTYASLYFHCLFLLLKTVVRQSSAFNTNIMVFNQVSPIASAQMHFSPLGIFLWIHFAHFIGGDLGRSLGCVRVGWSGRSACQWVICLKLKSFLTEACSMALHLSCQLVGFFVIFRAWIKFHCFIGLLIGMVSSLIPTRILPEATL